MSKVTIKMIADRAGVSRGTVDRVLNRRPYVSDEIRRRVLDIAEELHYSPNPAARALKNNDRKIAVRVLIPSQKSAYSDAIRLGIAAAAREFASAGVSVELAETAEISCDEQLALLDRAEQDGVSGLAIIPYEDERILRRLRSLAKRIPVATMNTDVGDVGDLCYVGQNHYACGRVAAQLMGLLLGGQGNVLVSLGYEAITSHKQRRDGFLDCMRKKYPGIRICNTFENREDDEAMYRIMEERTARFGRIDGVYVCAGGIDGLCRYLLEHGLEERVSVVCSDFVNNTVAMLKRGVIDFAIGEQLFEQGYFAVKLLTEYLLDGTRPAARKLYTNIDIRTSENIDYSFSAYRG